MNAFNEKVAIVTGAASGIGQALAEELCRRGAHVVLTDWKEEQVCSVSGGISSACGSAAPVCLDVTDFDAFKKIVDDTVEKYGRLDYLFNNAGIAVGGEVRDVTIEDWRNVLNVNLNGVVHGVAAAYPVMVSQGFGHIINTASIEGLVAFPGTASYVASKHAVVGLSHSLRAEAKELGVNISVVCPGHIKTAIFRDSKMVNLDREKVLDYLARIPGITPAECAKEILKGVEKNKAMIVVTAFAKILHMLQRISPALTARLIFHDYKKLRAARRLN